MRKMSKRMAALARDPKVLDEVANAFLESAEKWDGVINRLKSNPKAKKEFTMKEVAKLLGFEARSKGSATKETLFTLEDLERMAELQRFKADSVRKKAKRMEVQNEQ